MWEILKIRRLSERCEIRPQKQKEQKHFELAASAKLKSRKRYNDSKQVMIVSNDGKQGHEQ